MSVENLLNIFSDKTLLDDYLQTLAHKQSELELINIENCHKLNSLKQSISLLEVENKQIKKINSDVNNAFTLQTKKLNAEIVLVKDLQNLVAAHEKLSHEYDTQLKKYEVLQNPKTTETRSDNFIAYSNGTALDIKTDLMWCRFSIGQQWSNGTVFGTAKKMTCDNAKYEVDQFNRDAVGGYKDWRIPNLEELRSLKNLDRNVFIDNVDGLFWTCTRQSIFSLVFYVNFKDNKLFRYDFTSITNEYHIRLVRG